MIECIPASPVVGQPAIGATLKPVSLSHASKLLALIFCVLFCVAFVRGAEPPADYETFPNLSYRNADSANAYMQERCKLDVYRPKNEHGVPTIVWFHGGGLTSGAKNIPAGLKQQKIIVISVNYRLLPKVGVPECIDDAAAAIAWTFKQIESYGGDRRLIFVGGHSAGGYLSAMVTLDKHWLAKYGISSSEIAGLLDISGQSITHFALRKSRGIAETQPIIDEFAPLYHVRKDLPPILLVTAAREKELLGRYEENAYFWRMLKVVGHTSVELHECLSANHGTVVGPAQPLMIQFVRKHSILRLSSAEPVATASDQPQNEPSPGD